MLINKRQVALFVGGALFGSVGTKLLQSRDAKKGYAHVVAAALRVKDEVVNNVTVLRENCSDIMAEARSINERRKSEEDAAIVEDHSEEV